MQNIFNNKQTCKEWCLLMSDMPNMYHLDRGIPLMFRFLIKYHLTPVLSCPNTSLYASLFWTHTKQEPCVGWYTQYVLLCWRAPADPSWVPGEKPCVPSPALPPALLDSGGGGADWTRSTGPGAPGTAGSTESCRAGGTTHRHERVGRSYSSDWGSAEILSDQWKDTAPGQVHQVSKNLYVNFILCIHV